MDTTRAQQQALDDELVAPADCLKIGRSNLRLSLTLKSKEPTLQVVLDALKLTPFYNAFEISADVPEIFMQELWVTVSRHHSSLRFKLNGKSHTVNVDNFRDMLKICPKLPGQKFKEPPLEEDILSFIRDLGHTGEIKFLSDVNVNHMHQPWRSFAAIINKCLSGKTMTLESLRLSRAQILWGMYHNKKVHYVYLLWEDLMFQVENKNSKKNNDMYYPRFTETPKPKTTKKKANSKASPKTKTTQATKGKRIKSSAKGDKAAKKKQPAQTSIDKGLTMLSDVALTGVEQLKLVIERSKTQTHSSYASGSSADEGTEDDEDEVNVNEKDDDNDNNDDDDDADNQDDENPDEENQDDDDDDEQTNPDNDGDDFVHPKFSTHDNEARQEEANEEDNFDPIVQTPSHVESTDDEDNDEEVQGVNIEGEAMDEAANNEEDEGNDLYRDLNVNLEGRDVEMTDDQPTNVNSRVLLCHLALCLTCSTPDQIQDQVKEQVKAQVSKILPKIEKLVNDQLEYEVLIRSSNKAKTSHAVAANLSELELKKILIDKMEANKSIDMSDIQKNLYKALVNAYDADKDILDAYGDNVTIKQRKEPESTSAPKEKTFKTAGKSTEGSKSHHRSAGKSAQVEEPMHTARDLEEHAHQEFDIGTTEEQSDEDTSQHPDWIQKPAKLPTPDRDWNKTLPTVHGSIQPWLSNLA
ncbi:hypothetical protein Tco_0674998, partial [Tanacetum coccineum]